MSARLEGFQTVRSVGSARGSTAPTQDESAFTEAARLDKQVDDSVNEINRLMREIGGRLEEVGLHVFEVYFNMDVERALSTQRQPSAGFSALLQRTGNTLNATRSQLVVSLRVAALNTRLKNTRWVDLTWSVRVELLPLLGSSLDFDALTAGVRYASQHRASVRQVREWVANKLQGATGREALTPVTTPTVTASEKAVSHYNALSRSVDRRRLINRFMNLPEDRRLSMLSNMKSGLRNLEKLTQEFEQAMSSD